LEDWVKGQGIGIRKSSSNPSNILPKSIAAKGLLEIVEDSDGTRNKSSNS
jgi:hypothetical protein